MFEVPPPPPFLLVIHELFFLLLLLFSPPFHDPVGNSRALLGGRGWGKRKGGWRISDFEPHKRGIGKAAVGRGGGGIELGGVGSRV